MTDQTKKGLNRRLALGGAGAAAALGVGYLAFGQPKNAKRHPALDPHTFYRGNAAEPESLDPSLIQATWEDWIAGDLLTGLLTYSAEGKGIPGMATSWTTAPDGLTWTFKLREALWSDGKPVTAEDFVFSWQRTVNPATASSYAYFFFALKNARTVNAGKMPLTALGVKALDSTTLEIKLEHPVPYLLQMLTHNSMYPQPKHVVEAKGKAWARPGNYVSNGAYILQEWVPNDHVLLVKNPHFYDAANVAIERVLFYPTDDHSAALRRMRAGELDMQEAYPAAQIGWIKANMPELLNPVPQMTTEFISINVKRKPFDDVRVRAAINMAINREMLVEKITRGGEPPAYSLVPPGTSNFPGGNVFAFKTMPYPARLAEAQRLMREAGYGPERTAEATYAIRSTAPGNGRAEAVAIQQALALIHINISILPFDAAIFYDTIQQHDFDLAQAGWQADFDDAATFLELFQTGSGNNWGQYSNPAFDALLKASQQALDINSRGEKLAAAEAMALKDNALVPLFFWINTNLVRPYVKGWVANKMEINRSRWISFDQKARGALVV
jgi:oligopeptide transport system substrate-binding protein